MSDGTVVIDTLLDETGIKSGLSKLNSLVKTGTKVAIEAVATVGTALVGAAGYAVKVGSDFEAGMSEVSAISGSTGAELQALTDKAKEMGATTKFSATQSAEAFKYMAMAGWDSQQMVDGIAGVMNLAAASGEDLATTSDIVTDALTAFGLQASDSGHFADVLAKASSSANTNVSMMGETFKYVAPVAGALGYSVEDMSVAIGLMANSGIKASQAGTSLRSVLSRMAKPTDEVQTAMNALGLSLTDADGNMKSFNDIMLDMRKGFSGLTEDQKASYAAMLGGQEAMSGLLAIANASESDFNNLSDAIANCDGAAESMANTMNDNLQGQITLLKSAVEGLGIEVYEGLQTPLKNLAKEGSKYVGELSSAFKEAGLPGLVGELGNVFAQVAVKAANAAPQIIDSAVNMLNSFVSGLTDNSEKIVNAGVDMVKSLVKGLGSLAGSLTKLAKEATSALVKNLFGSKVSKAFDDMAKTAKDSLNSMKKSFQSVLPKIVTLLGNVIKVASQIAKAIFPILAKAVDLVAKNFNILLPIVVGMVAAFKAFSIINTVTASVKTFMTGLSAAKTAITAATTAQQILNAVCSANPYILLAAAIIGVVTALGALALTASDSSGSANKAKEAHDKLTESYKGVGEAASNFSSKVSTATGILDGLTSSAIVSSEKQQELASQMESVQGQITDIFATASQERRELTQSEITSIEELMAKEQELADKQLQYEEMYQSAVKQKAEITAQTHYESISDYEDYAANIAKSAEDTKNKVVSTAEDQYTQEIINLKNKFDTCSDYTQEAYQEDIAAAQLRHDNAVNAANKECSDTYAILADGYYNNATALQDYNNSVAEKMEQKHQIDEAYNQKYQELQAQIDACGQMDYQKRLSLVNQQMDLENKYKSDMADIESQMADDMNDNVQTQLGAWMELAGGAAEHGSELTNKMNATDSALQACFDGLPEATRDKFARAWVAANNETDGAHESLIDKAGRIASGMLSRLQSVFDIHSPSRKMKKLFGYAWKGAENATEDGGNTLVAQSEAIAEDMMAKFNGANLDTSGLVTRMKSAVQNETMLLSSDVNASIKTVVDNEPNDTPKQPIVINSTLEVDGKTVARSTSPYVSQDIAREVRRKR